MKDKEKYYKPEIEEFHIGFEYEASVYNIKKGSFWFKTKMDLTFDFYTGNTRVKYLDREDIESLGFVFKKETEASYVKDSITMHVYDAKRWNTENDTITIFKRDLIRTAGKTIIFSGTIKNKSELKKLLKMLNIL